MTARVLWRCPCGAVLRLQPCRAKKRKVCGLACPMKERIGGRVAAANRLKRVMFQFGCTEQEARFFCKGWRAGWKSGEMAMRRRAARRPSGVGSSDWLRVTERAESMRSKSA